MSVWWGVVWCGVVCVHVCKVENICTYAAQRRHVVHVMQVLNNNNMYCGLVNAKRL